jgi:DNA-directed RNA polymerase subunit RPC12/RpoP
MTSVELRPAYVWTCTSCGRDNWRHAMYALPTRVVCQHCGTTHEVKQKQEAEDGRNA